MKSGEWEGITERFDGPYAYRRTWLALQYNTDTIVIVLDGTGREIEPKDYELHKINGVSYVYMKRGDWPVVVAYMRELQ